MVSEKEGWERDGRILGYLVKSWTIKSALSSANGHPNNLRSTIKMLDSCLEYVYLSFCTREGSES